MDIVRIAIDGPSGSGKSTIAKRVASELAIDYIDTGAMYRAVGLKMIRAGLTCDDEAALKEMLENTEIDFNRGATILDGEDVSGLIRTEQVSKMASDCSALGFVRTKMVAEQQKMAGRKSVIMDGRDIGTVVLKDAEFKFFMTASAEERALRRFKELQEKGQPDTYEKVLEDINRRDYNDTHRANSPLMQAEDAELLDTTSMSIEQVTEYIIKKVKGLED